MDSNMDEEDDRHDLHMVEAIQRRQDSRDAHQEVHDTLLKICVEDYDAGSLQDCSADSPLRDNQRSIDLVKSSHLNIQHKRHARADHHAHLRRFNNDRRFHTGATATQDTSLGSTDDPLNANVLPRGVPAALDLPADNESATRSGLLTLSPTSPNLHAKRIAEPQDGEEPVRRITLSRITPVLDPDAPLSPATTSYSVRLKPTPVSPTTSARVRIDSPIDTDAPTARPIRIRPGPTVLLSNTALFDDPASISRDAIATQPTRLARPINTVHICIARPPPESDGDPLSEFTTFTITPTSSRTGTSGAKNTGAAAGTGGGSPRTSRNRGVSTVTLTHLNCANLLLASTSDDAISDSMSATSVLDPNSTLAAGPVDPNTGDDSDGGNGDVAFFATPAGKGTIAGVSIGSAALFMGVILLFFIWKKKKHENGTEDSAAIGRTRRSNVYTTGDQMSSFGDSTESLPERSDARDPFEDGLEGIAGVGVGAASQARRGHTNQPDQPEMSQVYKGPPGSFFVHRRSGDFPAMSSSPRASIRQRPGLSTIMSEEALAAARQQHHTQSQTYLTAARGRPNENAGSGEDENQPSSGSSNDHGNGTSNDPFTDPSSSGHGHVTTLTGAASFREKHERRRSGYTSDTYRKSRSRPLSVRNPDSDETVPDGGENTPMARTPMSASSEAIYSLNSAPLPDMSNLESYLAKGRRPSASATASAYQSQAATPRASTPPTFFSNQTQSFPLPPSMPSSSSLPLSSIQYPIQSMILPGGGVGLPPTPREAQTQRVASWEENESSPIHIYGHAISDYGLTGIQQHHRPQPQQQSPASQYSLYGGYDPTAQTPSAHISPRSQHMSPANSFRTAQQTIARPSPAFSPHPIPPAAAAAILTQQSRDAHPHSHHHHHLHAHDHHHQHQPVHQQQQQQEHGGRATRNSIASSSDGNSSARSSVWRAWEQNNRSWVNEGFETPNEVQDVQLGANTTGPVGGGNATSISGYFAWR